MKSFNWALSIALLPLVGCNTTKRSSDVASKQIEPAPEAKQPPILMEIWQKHVDEETKGKAIQPDCKPTHFAPPEGVAAKGVVVFYHGFTACPQQFFVVGQQLAELGFDVFLPLMPGQGRMPLAKKDKKGFALDDLDDLPTGKDLSKLDLLTNRMNEIADNAIGVKVVGGLSGGGGLATATAIRGKKLWDRALVMAPFYKFTKVSGMASAVADRIVPDFTFDYDEECKNGRGKPGLRHGFCSVTVDAMRTMLDFGHAYRKRISEMTMQTMFVLAEKDPTILNSEVIEAQEEVKNSALCLMYEGVPHSMLSRVENLKLDHAWNESLERGIVDFVAKGQFFPTEGKSKSEDGKPLCKVVKTVNAR